MGKVQKIIFHKWEIIFSITGNFQSTELFFQWEDKVSSFGVGGIIIAHDAVGRCCGNSAH